MITDFLQKQIEFIKGLAGTFEELFEEPVKVEFLYSDVFTAAVVECDSDKLVSMMKHRLFNWQLENTSSWDKQLIHITDLEGKCILMDQSQQITILQC